MKMTIERKGTPTWSVHPGEILKEEFLEPLKMTTYRLAKELNVPTPRINDIVIQKRGISPETAVLLARFFNTSEQFWMNLQDAYDIQRTKHELAPKLRQIKPLAASASRG
jgi:addiction module HigA family antidote